MSDITANIVVTPIDLNVTVSNNQLTFIPNGIGLNFYTGAIGVPGGENTQVQYNDEGILNGTSNLTYSGGVTTISNVNVTTFANFINASNVSLGAIGNVHISGGIN